MANGRLAGVLCATAGDNLIYTAPAGQASTTVITLSAIGTQEVVAHVSVTTGAAPAAADRISPIFTILEEPRTYTGLVLDANQRLYVNVNIADQLVVSVNGLEGII